VNKITIRRRYHKNMPKGITTGDIEKGLSLTRSCLVDDKHNRQQRRLSLHKLIYATPSARTGACGHTACTWNVPRLSTAIVMDEELTSDPTAAVMQQHLHCTWAIVAHRENFKTSGILRSQRRHYAKKNYFYPFVSSAVPRPVVLKPGNPLVR